MTIDQNIPNKWMFYPGFIFNMAFGIYQIYLHHHLIWIVVFAILAALNLTAVQHYDKKETDDDLR